VYYEQYCESKESKVLAKLRVPVDRCVVDHRFYCSTYLLLAFANVHSA